MNSLMPLIENETVKMIKKRRFLVVMLIILILIPIFTYAQMKVAKTAAKQYGTTDWRVSTTEQIRNYTNRLSSSRVPDDYKQRIRVEVKRLQYYLDKNVDPRSPDAVTFTREFIRNAIGLFLPLLVAVLASDMVSGEQSTGTIKLLLTRPVRRWKILLSKLLTLLMFVSLVLLATAALAYGISGLVFGYGGWSLPVFTGYQITGSELSTANLHAVDSWQFLLLWSLDLLGCPARSSAA